MSEFTANPQQEAAINEIYGHVMIISCPGSGKTTTLIRRIDNILKKDGGAVLMVTFTRAAAAEMAEKYKKKYGNTDKITFSTIHSLCFKILTTYGTYDPQDLLTEEEKRRFIKEQLKGDYSVRDVDEAENGFVSAYSMMKNRGLTPQQVVPEGIPEETFLRLVKAYENMKHAYNRIDFDDMLLYTLTMLRSDKELLSKIQRTWKFIQVDEYQDTNRIQKEVLYLLAKSHKNLCVAGDDDQSIYRFRGAEPGIMMDFPKDFPDAKIMNISTNYRSEPAIIRIAGNLISCNNERFKKDFKAFKSGKGAVRVISVAGKLQQSAALIKQLKDLEDPEQAAILYRTNAEAETIADILSKNNIPFKSTEKIPSIYESWIWNDIAAYYEATKTDDVKRIINRPNRFLGKVYSLAEEKTYDGLYLSACNILSGWKLTKALESLKSLYDDLDVLRECRPVDFFTYLMEDIGYGKYIQEYYEMTNRDDEYVIPLQLLEGDSMQFDSMEEWIAYAKRKVLFMKNINKDGVTLSTMHRSKGLEWDHVFIINCNQGIIPSKKAATKDEIEEERRLFYVALTRARKEACIYYEINKPRSVFIDELKPRTVSPEKRLTVGFMIRHPKYGICVVTDIRNDKIEIQSTKTKSKYIVTEKDITF